jgi:hypothetical protein
VSLLDILLQGKQVRPTSNLGKITRKQGVRNGPEFKRIDHLPRRTPEVRDRFLELCKGGVLRDNQAIVLWEFANLGRGHVAIAKVGSGKSLIGFLAPVVCGAKRPLMLQPAKLVEKTRNELAKYSHNFAVCESLFVLNYEKLGLVAYENFLQNYKPDLLILDEAHYVRRKSSGRAKRLKRYFDANPDCRVLVMTGTGFKDKIADLWLSQYALKDLSPIPSEFNELKEWGEALDLKVTQRLAPGVLSGWADSPTLESVRTGVRNRIAATPGFTVHSSSGYDGSLTIIGHQHTYAPGMDTKMERLRSSWETPDGVAFSEATALSMYAQEMSAGFWYRYVPPPPEEWRNARRDWAKFVREDLKHNRSGRDTELQVALACSRGALPREAYDTWKAVKGSYNLEKHRETVWFDDSVCEFAIKWAEEHKGLVFCKFPTFGQRCEQMSGLPFFWRLAAHPTHGSLNEYTGGPAFVSLQAGKEGLNVQDRYSKILVIGAPSSAADWEQMIGRVHRVGQAEPEVEAHVFLGVEENLKAFHQARKGAIYSRDQEGNSEHKLLIADIVNVPEE